LFLDSLGSKNKITIPEKTEDRELFIQKEIDFNGCCATVVVAMVVLLIIYNE